MAVKMIGADHDLRPKGRAVLTYNLRILPYSDYPGQTHQTSVTVLEGRCQPRLTGS